MQADQSITTQNVSHILIKNRIRKTTTRKYQWVDIEETNKLLERSVNTIKLFDIIANNR